MQSNSRETPPTVVCIGAGPAGLTAGYLLSKEGIPVTVIERDPVHVGGISRTESYRGFRIDIGGHRFFSKSDAVEALWREILGPNFIQRPRRSRIYYRGKFFDYPLRAGDALLKLGILEAAACVLSYLRAQLIPIRPVRSFEDWVVNKFGRRLFDIFFRTYTEKVWGIKCSEISADWAAQRIKDLSLGTAILHSLRWKKDLPRNRIIKTLIDCFRYPTLGPGMMWEAAAKKIRAQGGAVHLGLDVVKVRLDPSNKIWTVIARGADGRTREFSADHVISSTSIRELVEGLEPPPPPPMRQAAASLRYRDFIVVALIVKERDRFDDNWIYIHDPRVRVGRIQNVKSWSPQMVPDAKFNCYCMEYFCFEDEPQWNFGNDALIALASREIVQLGLVQKQDILDGYVVRQPKAYPVYDDSYQTHVATVRDAIEEHYPNLHLVGRNGMHKYNNQDHAMMTAMLTVRNIVAGRAVYDIWRVNQDAEYLEAGEVQR